MDEQNRKKIKQYIVDFRVLDSQLNASSEALNYAVFTAMEVNHHPNFIGYLLKKENLKITMKMGEKEYYFTLLHQAINTSQPIKLIKFLIKRGAGLNVQDAFDNTPLHLAVVRCLPEVTALLLEHGANVNAIDDSGNTPLHKAMELEGLRKDKEAIVNLLLQQGANPYAKNQNGLRPINMASKSDTDFQKMTKLLQTSIFFKNPKVKKPEDMTPKNTEMGL